MTMLFFFFLKVLEKHNFGDEKKEICLTNEDPLPQDLLNFVRLAAMTEEEVIIYGLYFISKN